MKPRHTLQAGDNKKVRNIKTELEEFRGGLRRGLGKTRGENGEMIGLRRGEDGG